MRRSEIILEEHRGTGKSEETRKSGEVCQVIYWYFKKSIISYPKIMQI